MMKSAAGRRTADQCVSVFTLETFISSLGHPVVMLLSPFFQKNSKLKSLVPPQRKQKAGSDRSEPVFSPRTPQHTPSVCLHDRFYQGDVLRRGPSVSFGFLQDTFAAEDATLSESSFTSPGERLAREQDEPDSHKAKKPVMKIKKLKAKVNPASADVALVAVRSVTPLLLLLLSFF